MIRYKNKIKKNKIEHNHHDEVRDKQRSQIRGTVARCARHTPSCAKARLWIAWFLMSWGGWYDSISRNNKNYDSNGVVLMIDCMPLITFVLRVFPHKNSADFLRDNVPRRACVPVPMQFAVIVLLGEHQDNWGGLLERRGGNRPSFYAERLATQM